MYINKKMIQFSILVLLLLFATYIKSQKKSTNNNAVLETASTQDFSYDKTNYNKISLVPLNPEVSTIYNIRQTPIPILFNDNLSINCGGHIGEYDGKKLEIFYNPDNGGGFIDNSFVYGNELIINYSTNSNTYFPVTKLGSFDGSILSLITNPDNGTGYSGYPIVYQGKLFIKYNSSHGMVLGEYNHNSISIITSPPGSTGYNGSPIIYNGGLFLNYSSGDGSNILCRYNNNGIVTPIMNPDVNVQGQGYQTGGKYSYGGNPILYNGNLYSAYTNPFYEPTLAKYDGYKINLIPSPKPLTTYLKPAIVYNNNLYLLYSKDRHEYQVSELVQFNGSDFKIINNLGDGGIACCSNSPIIYNSKLYLKYQTASGSSQLAEYDGTDLKLIDNPDGGSLDLSSSIVFEDKLYFSYATVSQEQQLAVFDGEKISLIPNPDELQYFGNPIIFKNKLYFELKGTYTNALGLGYLDSDLPMQGDLIVYWDEKDKIYSHAGIVEKVSPNSDIILTVRSKWSQGGAVYDHDPNKCPYANPKHDNWSIWRRKISIKNQINWSHDWDNYLDYGNEKGSQFLTDLEEQIFANAIPSNEDFINHNLNSILNLWKESDFKGRTANPAEGFPDAKRVEEYFSGSALDPNNVNYYLKYDCRGFVFGHRQYPIPDPKQGESQVQRIILDGYQPIHAEGTDGKPHYWSLDDVKKHPDFSKQ